MSCKQVGRVPPTTAPAPASKDSTVEAYQHMKGHAMKHTHTHTEAGQDPPVILELQHNGDPYGTGFVGSESRDGGVTWVHRGDAGARSRDWWRREARALNAVLREVRR